MKKLLPLFLLLPLLAAQEIRRPTVETRAVDTMPSCYGTVSPTMTPLPNFYDALGESTGSDGSAYHPDDGTEYQTGVIYSGFAAPSGAYSLLKLYVYSGCTLNGSGSTNAHCAIRYSLDAGTTWSGIYSTAVTKAVARANITLAPTQDLSQIRVRYCADGIQNSSTSLLKYFTFNAYDIRTEGTLSGTLEPSASPEGAVFNTAQAVSLSSGTAGAVICYTEDGSAPTQVGNACSGGTTKTYTTSIAVTVTETINALATKAGLTDSPIHTSAYVLTPVASVFSPAGGSFSGPQTVTITNTTPGVALHYLLGAGTANCSSPEYTESGVVISSSTTLQSVACLAGWTPQINSSVYTIGSSAPKAVPAAIITRLEWPVFSTQ